jgi:DNA-binding MarR family transcriptional regulator
MSKIKAEVALEMGRSMHELRNSVRQAIQLKIKENGINITFEMLEVMSCLWRKDGVNQQEIADFTMRDKSSMTYLLDNLVKRKMVKRVEDENDRRNKLIYLTPQGVGLKDQLYPWALEAYEVAAEGIDLAEIEQSMSVLNKMIANLKKT